MLKYSDYTNYLGYNFKYKPPNVDTPVGLCADNIIEAFDKKYKLIFYPLSDLTKKIDSGVIPIIELAKVCFSIENQNGLITEQSCILSEDICLGLKSWEVTFSTFHKVAPDEKYTLHIFETGYNTIEFRFRQYCHGSEHSHAVNNVIAIIEKMKELQLDYNRLIGRNLAIDYNSL